MRKTGKSRIAAMALAIVMVLLTLATTAFAADSQFAGEEWYDQIETVEVNREPAHASFVPYESAEKALANEKSVLDALNENDSEYYQTLNGTWKFYFSQKPADRLSHGSENWNTSGWDTIEVPSNIQTQKNSDGSFKYDKPIYVNQRYPWANYETVDYNNGSPVAPTVTNGVGHYKRTFTLPDSWDGRQVFVSFQGVESAFYLYINGQQVGYAEDSYTADDFNITSYLQTGENTIAVEVYRWSDGSYLENQDFIRLSGIFRDVYLYSKADVALRDIFATTELNSDYTQATVKLSVDVKNLAASSGNYTVEAQLYDANDNAVWNHPASVSNYVSKDATIKGTGTTFEISKTVSNPQLWYADSPYLYRLLVQLKDRNGNVLENACIRLGMREIGTASINDAGQQQIQINGKKIMIRGTNRQEIHAEDGRAISRETILEDVQMLKAFNFNAVRTSHYPNNPYFYDLADELGLYLCDEANIESHMGSISSDIPSGYPVWNASVMDRTKNMVERDKNHPSVIIWSLGNEATYKDHTMDSNYCFYNSTRWILERDPSRLRKYERDNRYTAGNRGASMVDVYSSQYWGVDYCKSHITNTSNKLPYIQSEYAHAMGTGLGNLKEYWDLFRTYDNANGGFIWDWIDQTLLTTKDGQEFNGYGGDWGETVTDNDFCANGMVNGDRTPSPELYEAKKVQQEISFYDEDVDNGQVRIVNEFTNTNLNAFRVLWTYTEDNKVIGSGELSGSDINIAPGAKKSVTVNLPDAEIVAGSDYVLTFSVVLKEDAAWVGEYGGHAGDEIAFEQFLLNKTATAAQPTLNVGEMGNMTVSNTADSITFTGTTDDEDSFEIVISKTTGYLTRYQVDDKDLLTSGPKPNYYRAPTSNDIGASAYGVQNAAENFTVSRNQITVDQKDKFVTVTIPGEIASFHSENTLEYTVYANGMVVVTNTFTPSSACGKLTRIGMVMELAPGMEQVTYYGRGDQENYIDRNTGAKLGVYETTVSEMFESKRVKPQENGNRTDTRWVALTDDSAQIGLLVSAEDTMEFSALHYTAAELASKKHPYELNATNNTVLTVDYAQRGLGNASCGADTMAKYQLPTGLTYTHTYSLRPITGKSTDSDFVDSCMEKSNQSDGTVKVESTYLSDMKWTEDNGGYFANTRDKCDTRPIQLQVNGKAVTYQKGVGMHATASVTVDITGKGYTRFTAMAGHNYNQVENNNGQSNVNLVVLVDGEEAFRKNNVGYNSSGNVFAVPIDVDVTNARTVTIKAEDGGYNGYDHVSWADAKFTSKPAVASDIVAVRNISTATKRNQVPTLPDTVSGVFADGTLAGEYAVKWDSMSNNRFSTVGSIVTVNGTADVNGKSLPVAASVRVAQETAGASENVAPDANVTQDVMYVSDNLASVNNGNKYPGNNSSERWTNYNNRGTSDTAALTFAWDEARFINSADLYYYLDDYGCALPNGVKIEYYNGSRWRSLTVSESKIETYELGAQYRYTFNEVETTKLRITLTQQSTVKGVGLTEVEINGYQKGIQRYDNAALSAIQVDGKDLEAFDGSVLNYAAQGTEVTAEADENAAVTILPVYEDVVRILTLSENGKRNRTYSVNLGTDVCNHVNTELRNAREATCEEEGYTGDQFCTVCEEIVEKGTVIPKTDHMYKISNQKEPTCDEAGYTGDKRCTVCGDEKKGASIAPLFHTWDAGEITKEPTETETGIKLYHCTRSGCGGTKEEILPILQPDKEWKVPTASLRVVRGEDGKLKLTGVFDDYENKDDYYEVTAHGLVYYATVKLGRKTLTVNTPGRTRVNFSAYQEDGSFVYNMKPANGNTKYTVRAFLAYTNSQGRTVYVYSAPIAASFNGLPVS